MLKITTLARWMRTTAPTSRLGWKLELVDLRAIRTSREVKSATEKLTHFNGTVATL